MPEFGSKITVGMFSVQGVIDLNGVACLAQKLLNALQMEQAYRPASWNYPNAAGKGGKGVTYILPITDSFIAIDTWLDLGGFYLHICSCKRFGFGNVVTCLESLGYSVTETKLETMSLEKPRIAHWTEVAR